MVYIGIYNKTMNNLNQQSDELLIKVIMENHPELLDDELSDILNNQKYVEEAEDILIEMTQGDNYGN